MPENFPYSHSENKSLYFYISIWVTALEYGEIHFYVDYTIENIAEQNSQDNYGM